MKKINFKEYWAKKSAPDNRRDDDNFCQKKVDEILLHIKRGGILLDYGCGNCNQTKFLSSHFDRIIAVDFSKSMLIEAENQVELHGIKNIILLQADEDNLWGKIGVKVDAVIATSVIQYFSSQKLEQFVKKCAENILDDGHVVFFDVINPLKFIFFKHNLINKKGTFVNIIASIIHATYIYFFRSKPDIYLGEIGFGYYPDYFLNMGRKYNLNIIIVSSIYYEYRYHVIIQKK